MFELSVDELFWQWVIGYW